jgi:ABC-type phosphate/phosphonate transport system substrate-binding protein
MIYVSEAIPGDTLATTKKFAAENKKIIATTVKLLSKMGKDPEGKKILTALYRIDSMVPADSRDFQMIRDAAKLIHLD